MPFIDAAANQALRMTRRLPWLEPMLLFSGWLLGPLALLSLIVTGELLAAGWAMRGLPPFATLRGLHLLSAGALLLVLAYRGFAGAVAFARWGHRPGLLGRMFELRHLDWGVATVRVLTWASLLLLVWSGLERHAQMRFGWSAVPPGDAALWAVVHRVACPYFYAFLVFSGFLRLRRFLPSFRDYLVRQY